jgi:hypothetical protein
MAEPTPQSEHRDFHCIHCGGNIRIPRALPPTTGPCPLCGGVITSPADGEAASPAPRNPPPVTADAGTASPAPAAVATRGERLPDRVTAKRTQTAEPASPPLKVAVISLLMLIIFGGIATVLYFLQREMSDKTAATDPKPIAAGFDAVEANYIRSGWKSDAAEVLRGFIAATTSKGKLPYILSADALAQTVEDFYGGGEIFDSDTPAEAFSAHNLSEEDRKRGIFMMVYDQPPQFDMKEFFRPLAPLEVQHGLEPVGLLLSTVARAENFAVEPVRVHAFFKRTAEGLKLDWEIFAQTKYRTFQNFVELPDPGASQVFRVFIVEDVPSQGRAVSGSRTYRLADPANVSDTARINVMVDSEPGRALSIINWRGSADQRPVARTATVELNWSHNPDDPELRVSRFICWEFLGLGGQATPDPDEGP